MSRTLGLSLFFHPNSSDQRDAVRSSRPRAHHPRLTLSPMSAQMQFPRWTDELRLRYSARLASRSELRARVLRRVYRHHAIAEIPIISRLAVDGSGTDATASAPRLT